MDAQKLAVGVYPLDQIRAQGPTGPTASAAALGRDDLSLAPDARPEVLGLIDTLEGFELAVETGMGGLVHPVGASVRFKRKAPAHAVLVVLVDEEPVGLAAGPDGGLLRPALDPKIELAGFGRGTLIDTPEGPKPVETLGPGDLVTTLDNGSQPLAWVGRQALGLTELLADPALRPVHFAAGAAGNRAALTVACSQRLLIDDWRAEVYFAEDRVLVAAQALIDDRLARLDLPLTGVEYWYLLCNRHEILIADGTLSESYHPGETGYAGLAPANRILVEAVVPEPDIRRRRAACPIVRNAEARALRLPG
jgi:hypothetical protein